MKDLLTRLEDKFLVGDGCWRWTAAKNSRGYGTLNLGERWVLAHRIMYETLVGPISDGLVLDHLCRNRACVRPGHLEPVTQQENLLRGETITAHFAAKDCCPAGHLYDEENTYLWRGGRHCRACRREQLRAHRSRRKGA